MIRNKTLASIFTLFLLLPIAFIGCGGGGSDDTTGVSSTPQTSSQAIEVLPSDYDFGIVTPGNSVATLETTIKNNGSGNLDVSDIALSDTNNFVLDLSGGSNPCNKVSPTIAAGENCTAEVAFQPTSDGVFQTTLGIESNDPINPVANVLLSGSQESLSELTVRINQVETCPGPVVTAYVSVTDQGEFPVTGLTKNDFSVTENGTLIVGAPTDVSFVSNNADISVALAMDYSGSITSEQDNVDDMEESVAQFVDQIGVDDEAEIVKFDDIVEIVQNFTSDKNDLKAAIYAEFDYGINTRLYDAVVKAVDDIALRLKDRRAVILISDGKDDDGSGNQLSDNDLNDAINYAKANDVPIFTIALGNFNSTILQQLADDTGGQFYEATTSDNLRTIYQQLADVLFHDQYILTYTSGLGAGGTADLTIEATLQTQDGDEVGNDTREITSCSP